MKTHEVFLQIVFWAISSPSVHLKAVGRRSRLGIGAAETFLGNADVESLLTGQEGLKSYSWPEITNLVRSVLTEVQWVRDRIDVAHTALEYHSDVGLGVIGAFTVALILILVWCWRNWENIGSFLTKWKDQIPPVLKISEK